MVCGTHLWALLGESLVVLRRLRRIACWKHSVAPCERGWQVSYLLARWNWGSKLRVTSQSTYLRVGERSQEDLAFGVRPGGAVRATRGEVDGAVKELEGLLGAIEQEERHALGFEVGVRDMQYN